MANENISSSSLDLINQRSEAFKNEFRLLMISDTVQDIIKKALPIKVNDETQQSEILNQAHADELNNLINKSARDLTNDAIKGKIIKTNFQEGEEATNYLDSVSQTVESFINKETNQRVNWFKLQIQNGKIPDSSKDYNTFKTKLELTFQRHVFTVEDFDMLCQEQLDLAKTFEEEDIIENIKESVMNEINQSETRQNHLVEVMQTVQDTKKEYEEELEEKTNPETDLDMGAISEDASGENSSENPDVGGEATQNNGNSDEAFSMKQVGNDADKIAAKIRKKKGLPASTESVNMNMNTNMGNLTEEQYYDLLISQATTPEEKERLKREKEKITFQKNYERHIEESEKLQAEQEKRYLEEKKRFDEIKSLVDKNKKKSTSKYGDVATAEDIKQVMKLFGFFQRLFYPPLDSLMIYLGSIGKIEYLGKKSVVNIFGSKDIIEKTQEYRQTCKKLKGVLVIAEDDSEYKEYCDVIDIDGDVFRFIIKSERFIHLSSTFSDYLLGRLKEADGIRYTMSTEDANENLNDTKNQNDNPRKDGAALNNGNGAEGMGAMSTYQNADNFQVSSNSVGIGGYGSEYKGPVINDLGKGVLEGDESDLEKKTDEQTEQINNTDPNTTPDHTPIDTTNQSKESIMTQNNDGENIKITDSNSDMNHPERVVDPVRSTEISEDDVSEPVNAATATEEDINNICKNLLPLSLSKFESAKIYSVESISRFLARSGDNSPIIQKKISERMIQFKELVNSEKNVNTDFLKEKFKKFQDNWKYALEDLHYYSVCFAKMGISSNKILDNNNIFSLAVAKNIINRSSEQRKKGKKFNRILSEKDYGKSLENLVDYIFTVQALKTKLPKSQDIEKSMEEIAVHEEKINGAIYELNSEDKERCNSLKNLLGTTKFDKLFVYDEILLDFNNNLTRVKEDQEEAPINVLSGSAFKEKVLDKLEHKGFERNAALEEVVTGVIENKEGYVMKTTSLFEKILLHYGRKMASVSLESINNTEEKSKIYTKAKVFLTIRRSAEALGLANPNFIKSFDEAFSIKVL